MSDGTRTAFRTCPLCEAGCGLEITLRTGADGREAVTRIRGDRADVFSRGFICPKGSALKPLQEDPDRLRRPLVKRDGTFVEVDWDEAWAEVDRRLRRLIDAHGRKAIGVYVGNPTAHSVGAMLYLSTLLRALGTKSVYTASTADQRPKEVSAGLMFGTTNSVPVPDVDRTDFLLMLGANPWASNGSLATAPDWPGRIEALRARGGTLVVVDPRRSRTAQAASQWVPIRPGTDAHLLAAMANVLITEGLVDLGTVADSVEGVDIVASVVAPFTPDAVAPITGISAGATPRSGSPAGRRTQCRGVRADRHDHSGVRHTRQLAGGRAQRVHWQPGPARRGHVQHRRGRRRQHEGHARQGSRGHDPPTSQPGARAAGDER